MSAPKQFKPGDHVMIVGNPSKYETAIGLYGYILNQNSEGNFNVEAFKDHKPCKAEANKQWPSFRTTAFSNVVASDLRPLHKKNAKFRTARLMAFREKEKAAETKEEKAKDAKRWRSILAKITSPKSLARQKALDKKIETVQAKIGQVFYISRMTRLDKSTYPAYRSPTIEAIESELHRYASKGPKECTITELARWRQCQEIIAQASLWSNHDECRSVVQEFDLDPYVDEFNGALYRRLSSPYIPHGELRQAVIAAWNRGENILYIQDAEAPTTCARDEKSATGFFLTVAKRRQLPVIQP